MPRNGAAREPEITSDWLIRFVCKTARVKDAYRWRGVILDARRVTFSNPLIQYLGSMIDGAKLFIAWREFSRCFGSRHHAFAERMRDIENHCFFFVNFSNYKRSKFLWELHLKVSHSSIRWICSKNVLKSDDRSESELPRYLISTGMKRSFNGTTVHCEIYFREGLSGAPGYCGFNESIRFRKSTGSFWIYEPTDGAFINATARCTTRKSGLACV